MGVGHACFAASMRVNGVIGYKRTGVDAAIIKLPVAREMVGRLFSPQC